MPRLAIVSVSLCSLLLSPPLAHAGTDPVVPEREGLIKRKFHSFLKDDADATARPLRLGPFQGGIGILSSGAGPAPMLHFWTPDIGGSGLDLHASAAYSVYGYQYYDAQFGLVPHEGNRLPRAERGTSTLFPLSDLEKTSALHGFHIYVAARRRDYPREDFYGVGPASLKANRTDYRLRDDFFEGVIQTRVSQLSLMGRAGLLRPKVRPGTDSLFPNLESTNSERTAPGLFGTPDFYRASAGLWLELRDQPDNPHRGMSVGVALSRYDDRNQRMFQFSEVVVDAREYIPLGSHRHVLALRQVAFLDKPDAGSLVPFYLQPNFGGSSFLRGYGASRYRDNKLMALAAEYRFGLHPNVQLALIYEAGKVFPTMSSFGLRNLEHSYGAGFRLKSPRRVRFRIDVLHSSERTRLDVKLGPSF